jgi:DNA helicase-2/ATP-dependent DNA helicase PcrA
LEEERRLFYVAITRAKKKLHLTYANARYRFGQLQQNDPSRFLDEIDEKYVERSYAGGNQVKNNRTGGWGQSSAYDRMRGGFGGGAQQSSPSQPKTIINVTPARPQTKEHKPSENFEASDTKDLVEGLKVEHQKFGFGIIKQMEGAAHNPIATIQFDINGEKKIMLNYAKLRIVSQ